MSGTEIKTFFLYRKRGTEREKLIQLFVAINVVHGTISYLFVPL